MEAQRRCSILQVLFTNQQNSFEHVLTTNIQNWGHQAIVVTPSSILSESNAYGDVLLFDLDEALHSASPIENGNPQVPVASMPLAVNGIKQDDKHWPHVRLTIALSSFSVSRTTLERIGAVALLQKPFEMSRLQRYLRVLRSLLLEGEEIQQPGNNVAGHVLGARGDEEGTGDAAGRAGSPKLRILVVDDDVTLANVIRKTLIFESRYEVVVAYNGLEALEQCLRWKPHCIVTDLIMPWMNGYQVMRCLAASSLQTMPAFVIMSALAQL